MKHVEYMYRIPFSSCIFAFPRLKVLHHEVKSRLDCTSACDEGVPGAALGPAVSCWVTAGLGWAPFAMPQKGRDVVVSYGATELFGLEVLGGPDVVGTWIPVRRKMSCAGDAARIHPRWLSWSKAETVVL